MRILLAALLAATALAQEPPDRPVFRTGISLVHMDAEALTQDGRIIGGLGQKDFRVFDENKEQSIVQFAADSEPLDLILLFDISGSMNLVAQKVSAASHEAFKALRPGDRISVMVFNTRASVVSGFSEDLAEVERVIRDKVLDMRFGGGTLIQEAVDDAALRFLDEKRSERRRAVLIVTDNMGTRTRSEETIVRDFWEADAILSGLIIANPGLQALDAVNKIRNPLLFAVEAGMSGIASRTGGDVVHSADPGKAFESAIERIRTRYSLYYAMPEAKPGIKRLTRVELSPEAAKQYPRAKIRARTGYIVPAR